MGRSRGGCSNCKRRKRKCDETRPDCRACQRRGIQCEGYNTLLKWTNGIASRGRFAGAAIPDLASRGSDSNPTMFSAYLPTIDDPQPHDGSLSASLEAESLAQLGPASHSDTQGSQPSISSLASSPAGGISDPKQQLFQRFIHAGMHRLYTTESHSWPKAHFVAMGEKSQAFFTVCGAIQAYLEDGFSVSSMERVDLALQTFRSELESRHESFDASTVSAGLLLCSLCLLQARPWTMYLQLMADLYHLETSMGRLLPAADHDFTIRHSIEVLSIMDMEPMVIGRMTPSMGIWHHLRKVQDRWEGGRIGGIEIVSGMPRTLLDVIADIGNRDAQEVEARLWAWPGEIGLYAQCILWDCWKYTAVLDVRRIERKKKKMKSTIEAIQDEVATGKTSPFPTREVVMCRLAASVYALYRAVKLPANQHLLVHNGLMYPLVIGSLEVPILAAHPEWKHVFDDVRTLFLKKDSFHLIKLVDEVLNEAWREGTDTFDIEEAARTRGIEIAVF
ncbi:c6 finger domain-containing protein [Colletotrichum incanum]|uniref:C6 finger domain-containing protein n=1 Tax=Colletotrichum incanum TaxID=1573173 RepID=A0A161WD00_COLIC|nr:c6 finger domain-containing protein [Colletotrichum incanum]OHW98994.1 putative transcription factor [Colletotrichum incanum]